jgi:hypothetical protein
VISTPPNRNGHGWIIADRNPASAFNPALNDWRHVNAMTDFGYSNGAGGTPGSAQVRDIWQFTNYRNDGREISLGGKFNLIR